MNRRHQERQESQERLIPPFAPTLTTSQVPFHLTLPATTSVKLLSAAESSQNLLNDDGQTTTGSRPSVGFNIDVNIYHYCDYNKKGLLLDLLDKHGDKGLAREFKLMTPFMYCSGKGLTIKESCVDFSCSQREQSKDFKKRKSPTTEYLASDKQEKEDQTDNFLVRKLLFDISFFLQFSSLNVRDVSRASHIRGINVTNWTCCHYITTTLTFHFNPFISFFKNVGGNCWEQSCNCRRPNGRVSHLSSLNILVSFSPNC